MSKRKFYREFKLRMEQGAPATYNEANRSVEVIAATENPVMVYDYENRMMVGEVLLMSGLNMPENGQVPVLDSHSRWDTSSVVGSFRNMERASAQLIGRVFFSSAPEAESQNLKVKEGHLTDFSVGFRIEPGGVTYISEGESAIIDGRTFEGPLRVVTDWTLKELSVCPIGADPKAKARAEDGQPTKKELLMDPKMRAFLERHGLPKDATDAEAYDFMERLDSSPADGAGERAAGAAAGSPPAQSAQPVQQVNAVDPNEAARKAVEDERARNAEINATCSASGFPDEAARMIADGLSVDQARKEVLDLVNKKNSAEPEGFGHRSASVGMEDRDKFRAAAQDAFLVRSAFDPGRDLSPGATELAGRSCVEMCRMALVRAGMSDSGHQLEVVGRALMSTDMPIILGATANLSLMAGWEAADESWSEWVATGSVSDFKVHKKARASEAGDLDEVPEGGEYKYDDRDEASESYSVATYGKIFPITRQALINDDIGALTDIPYDHGEAASRKLGDVVYAVLSANSAMGDGVALFHANHSNLMTTGAVSEDTLAEGIKKMRQQKDIKGKRRLNIRPEFFIAPTSLEGSAEVFFASERFDKDDTAATRANIYSGSRFKRIYESRLDDDSTTAWYLAARKGKTIRLYFLDGVQRPYLEVQNGWSVDGVEHKVRIDAGAKAEDWRGISKNAGA